MNVSALARCSLLSRTALCLGIRIGIGTKMRGGGAAAENEQGGKHYRTQRATAHAPGRLLEIMYPASLGALPTAVVYTGAVRKRAGCTANEGARRDYFSPSGRPCTRFERAYECACVKKCTPPRSVLCLAPTRPCHVEGSGGVEAGSPANGGASGTYPIPIAGGRVDAQGACTKTACIDAICTPALRRAWTGL